MMTVLNVGCIIANSFFYCASFLVCSIGLKTLSFLNLYLTMMEIITLI